MKPIKSRQEFEAELAAGGRRLALFYSAWCPFCTSFKPAAEKRAKAAPGLFISVCTDDLGELEDMFSVDVVPTVLFFENGKLAGRLDGLLGRGLSEDGLREFVENCGCGEKRK